jgi:hypothetical protein
MLRKPASALALTVALLVTLVSVLWLGAAALMRPGIRLLSSPQAAVPTASADAPAKAPAGPPSAGASSQFLYTAPAAQPVATVVRRFWPSTSYMTRAELEAAFRQANNLGKATSLKSGQQVVIPGYEEHIVERPISVPPDFEVRAVYLTGTMAGSQTGLNIVRRWRQMGGNSIVFDIKDSDGSVNVPFDHPLAPHRSPAIPNLPKYVRYLHSLGMHAIARIALFRDEILAPGHPELAVRSRSTGKPWRENGKLVWLDSSNPAVQEYNLALAKSVAGSGVDEIQFDYVRFPAEGDQKDAQFAFQSDHPKWARSDVITDFVARAYATLHPTGVLFSLDVFGVTAWQEPVDLAETGQDVVALSRHCDILSPMIYPSHFFGMDGYKDPGDAPEHFISESMDRFRKILAADAKHESEGKTSPAPATAAATHTVILRPWLQAFGWRTKTYGVDYILTQVRVAKEHGGNGFLFWNARNDYSKPMLAMTTMRAAPGRYFRGDELPGVPAQKTASSATPTATTAKN